jgi:branched-subunit amino acid ABC-type transport system permease component
MSILPQLIVNSLIIGSIYALVAVGLALSYGFLKIFNFAHGHLMMAGAYLFYLFYVDLSFSLALAVLLTVFSASLLGAISFLVFVRPFKKNSFHLSLVATLALSTIIEAIVSLIFGVQVRSIFFPIGMDSIQYGNIFITPIEIMIVLSTLVIVCIISLLVYATPIGRSLQALQQNNNAAMSLGINEYSINLGTFIISTLLATYTGVLIGVETSIHPLMGNSYTVKAFACTILGGGGNIWATAIGAYSLGFIENVAIGIVSCPSGYRDSIAFIIILLILVIRPYGLFGIKKRNF